MSVLPGRNQGWRNYWKEDRNESCVAENTATATAIRERWIELFSDLANGSRILDVATGNGALLAHAAIAAERGALNFSLTGVDLADIDPVRYVSGIPDSLRKAEFKGGVAAEKLPFSDASFDVVVSQYGLEYADLDKALAEVERVLTAGGRLLWLAHNDKSLVVEQNQDQIRQVEFLLASGSPLKAMGSLVAKIKKRRNLEHANQKLRTALTAAEQYCFDHPPAKVIRDVCTVIAETAQNWQAFRPQDLDKMLSDSRSRLIAHRQRINDLLAAVITPDREEIIRGHLRQPSWENASFLTLRIGAASSQIGTLIEARRAADQAT